MKKLKSAFSRFINNPFVLLALSLPCPVIALNVKMTTVPFVIFILYCIIVGGIAIKLNIISLDNIIDLRENRENRTTDEFIQRIEKALDAENVKNPLARFEITTLMTEALNRKHFDDKTRKRIVEIYKEEGLVYQY